MEETVYSLYKEKIVYSKKSGETDKPQSQMVSPKNKGITTRQTEKAVVYHTQTIFSWRYKCRISLFLFVVHLFHSFIPSFIPSFIQSLSFSLWERKHVCSN